MHVRATFGHIDVDESPILLDAGSCPDDCSGSRKTGRRQTLRRGLEDQDAFRLLAELGRPASPHPTKQC